MRDDKIISYYNSRATEYEQIYYRENEARRKEIDDEAGRLRELASGKEVLELACGTGYWTREMSRTAKSIVALDASAEMVAEAQKKSYDCPVDFIVHDMFSYPYPPNSAELVAVGFWFSHHPRQEFGKLFELLLSPLRQGGSIWLIDNNPPAEGKEHQSAGYDEHGNHLKTRFLSNGSSHVIIKNYFSEPELRELFSRHFQLDRLTFGTYYWSVVLRPKD